MDMGERSPFATCSPLSVPVFEVDVGSGEEPSSGIDEVERCPLLLVNPGLVELEDLRTG